MKLVEMELDCATVVLDSNNHHLQPFGIVHGGVLATLIDTATFWAVFMRIPEDAGLVNVDLKLNYLKSVDCRIITAKGLTIRGGKSISYAEARVFNENDELLAHGTSTLMSLPGKSLPIKIRKYL